MWEKQAYLGAGEFFGATRGAPASTARFCRNNVGSRPFYKATVERNKQGKSMPSSGPSGKLHVPVSS